MLTVNTERLLNNLNELAQIGATPEGGVSRPALSEADAAGRAWFREYVEAAGFDFRADSAGNLSARLPAAEAEAQTLLAGSHLDTVAHGGRFDGALGVLVALEALERIKEEGLRLPYHLEAISFTDEEGTMLSMLGSHAFTGDLTPADQSQPRQSQAAFEAGLERLGLTKEGLLSAQRAPESLAGFVELHIEQGRRLERRELPIGVVTEVVGIRSHWLTFSGQAAHAGTTPMEQRQDALWGAATFVMQARALVQGQYGPGVMNCGQVQIEPGSFNIVPAEVRLALEFRHASEGQLDQMEAALLALAEEVAEQHGLGLKIEALGGCRAAPLNEAMIEAVEQAAERLGLGHTRLVSFAGHDAQNLSRITPTVLYFVPSVGGISHNPREFTRDEDVVHGANVMLQTLLGLAGVGE